ncbi:hemolysin-type calcium-binding protein [Oceanicola sp. 22II-s10i]|uniref:Hint domain-containing protein n=1 Tax=Oceanicola sp. 22II-s10i TaxID=1317116 RepID=UPI000B526E8F|nr:Hint domain-containing protein [Oceanicola sp. 22II-s10i]OWU85069.1 hemolysin-type calcium-binding protein [Oceanicola sp. 22II-s10i]
MRTGYRGTFVFSWSQTEVDGLPASPIQSLSVGSAWSWRGEVVRLDGPSGLLELEMADEQVDLRKRAVRSVRRLVGAAMTHTTRLDEVEVDDTLRDTGFVVTNGARSYQATVIETGQGTPPLLMFLDELPPRDSELWVVHVMLTPRREPRIPHGNQNSGFICFTPGTRIRTPHGVTRVEELREGDYVLTKDNGPQPVLWSGARRMSGARLYSMPWLRPIRIRTGAFGIAQPDEEFLVSPEHRMLVRGPVARALFNTSEVLVAARDLIHGTSIVQDTKVREVTYVHLLLPAHQIVWANGVETESFHPANASLDTLTEDDRRRLLSGMPAIATDAYAYGGFARRNLTAPEAAILMHEAA